MSDYTDIQPELDDFENAVYGEEVRSSMVSAIKKIHDLAESAADAPDASSATAGQVLTADGNGGHFWGDTADDVVPTNVRQAIYDMLSDLSDDEANLTIVDQWVQNSIVTALRLSPTSLIFNGAETKRITATPVPSTADISAILWESSDSNVATVSSGGVVTSVRNGTCTITASVSGISATCSVTVSGIVYPALDSYGEDLLLSTSNTINTLNPNHDKFVFGLVSDTHRTHEGVTYESSASYDSDRYSLKLLARIANAGLLDCVFHGGDMVSGRDDNAEYIQECIEATMTDIADYYNVPVYSTVGNHDKRYSTSRTITSNAYLKSQNLRGIKNKAGQTLTWIDDTNYYIDFSGYAHPIRIVVINEYDAIEGSSTASASTAANCTGAWIPAATVGDGTHNISAANAANTILGFVYHGMTYAQIKTTAEAYIEAGGYAVLGSFGGHWHNYSYSSSTDGFNDLLTTRGYANTDEINSNNEYGVSVFVVDVGGADVSIKWIRIGRDSGVLSYISLKPVPSEGILRAGTTTKWLNSYTINVSNNNANVEIPNNIKKYSTANLSKVSADVGGATPSADTDEVLFSVAAGDSIKTVVYFETGPTALNTENYYAWRLYTGSFATYLISGKLTTSMAGQTYENTITVDDDYDIYCIMFYWAGQSAHVTNPLKFKVSIYTQASGSDEWVLRTMDNKPTA